MSDFTDEDRRRIAQHLGQARQDEKDSALKSRESFFTWLWKVGLGYIVQKFLDLVWAAIKRLLGF
jgi:hypothetical protein